MAPPARRPTTKKAATAPGCRLLLCYNDFGSSTPRSADPCRPASLPALTGRVAVAGHGRGGLSAGLFLLRAVFLLRRVFLLFFRLLVGLVLRRTLPVDQL